MIRASAGRASRATLRIRVLVLLPSIGPGDGGHAALGSRVCVDHLRNHGAWPWFRVELRPQRLLGVSWAGLPNRSSVRFKGEPRHTGLKLLGPFFSHEWWQYREAQIFGHTHGAELRIIRIDIDIPRRLRSIGGAHALPCKWPRARRGDCARPFCRAERQTLGRRLASLASRGRSGRRCACGPGTSIEVAVDFVLRERGVGVGSLVGSL